MTNSKITLAFKKVLPWAFLLFMGTAWGLSFSLGKIAVENGAKPKGAKRKRGSKFVLWEIFSGTGVLGKVMEESYHWKVFQIDSNRDLCRKTNATCADVRQFDFDLWDAPDVIFAAPPCVGWTNSQKREVRRSKHMKQSRNLVQWTLALIRRYSPLAWLRADPAPA